MFQFSFLSLAVLLLPFGWLATSEFKVVKKDGPVVLYERWVNRNREEVRELKAEFSVKSNPDKLVTLLQNEALGLYWNNKAAVYKVLHEKGQSQWTNYIKYNMPFLMDDQDCCLSFSLDRISENIYSIEFRSSESESFPIQAGISRITGVSGKWLIERRGSGLCKVTYLISTDRNKNIPRMVSDPIVRSNLINTMKKVKSLLEH